ncbi:MAG: DUF2130 domain-containing protein [Thermodesulfovibrionales bacterium]|nr:DUF2130 domain-containing protein [Thermodesulfovibrionales bacterium]
MKKENIIICPQCGAEINVNEILYHQLQDQVKKEFELKSHKLEKEYEKRLHQIELEKEKIEREREQIKELIDSEVHKKLTVEKSNLEKILRQKIEEEQKEQIKELQTELQHKSEQIKELHKAKADIERLKREKEELRELIALEKEKEFTERLKEEKIKIKKLVEEDNYLRIKEKEKIIEDLKMQLEEAKRKADQGSIQLQGEIQELEIENMLRHLYPFDEIREIKKGQRGADIIQIVRTNQGIDCGKIYYESKRAKDFQNSWIQKLKEDNLSVKADILVIVSETLPEGIDKFGMKDNVWICTFSEVKGLSMVLRHGLMQVHSVLLTQQDKGTKMEMLYNYLTSNEFRAQFEAIIEGFKTLQDSYHEEKLKMQKIWKEREKQFEKILSNAVGFYGSLKGIAGASIPAIKMLEGKGTEE